MDKNDENEIKRFAKLINEDDGDYSDEYEGLNDEDEFDEDGDEDDNGPELLDRLAFENGDSIEYWQVGSDDTEFKLILRGVEFNLDDVSDDMIDNIERMLFVHKDELVQRLIDCRYGPDVIKSVVDGETKLFDIIGDMF